MQSQALILGGALGSGWVSLCRQHPTDESRPLIDFDMVRFLLFQYCAALMMAIGL